MIQVEVSVKCCKCGEKRTFICYGQHSEGLQAGVIHLRGMITLPEDMEFVTVDKYLDVQCKKHGGGHGGTDRHKKNFVGYGSM